MKEKFFLSIFILRDVSKWLGYTVVVAQKKVLFIKIKSLIDEIVWMTDWLCV